MYDGQPLLSLEHVFLTNEGQAIDDAQLAFMFGKKALPVQAIQRTDLMAKQEFIALPRHCVKTLAPEFLQDDIF